MIKELLASAPENHYSLTELANLAGLSAWHFLRQFKKYVGLPPHGWLVQVRLHKARQMLKRNIRLRLLQCYVAFLTKVISIDILKGDGCNSCSIYRQSKIFKLSSSH